MKKVQNNSSYTLLELFAHRRNYALQPRAKISVKGRDTFTISSAAKEMGTVKASAGRTHNRNVDQSIDLQKYIDLAAEKNREAIINAGSSISVKTRSYTSTGMAFRQALEEKYTKLAKEAKTHSNPELYIHQKYFDKNSKYYETDLDETERSVAYAYELQMIRNGKLSGVNFQDSLFRGIQVSGDVVDRDKLQFERQMVNAQIGNILQNAGIAKDSLPDTCAFSVDPYDYRITVAGVDDGLKVSMENALNVGDNGKNLFHHIYKCATQDGADSSQVTKASRMKYEAYHQIESFTGLKLNELKERNGTYYTEDGRDIVDVACRAVDDSADVPHDFKQQMKEWIRELITGTSAMGWKNIPDMTLGILFTRKGLMDTGQSIIYGNDASDAGKPWYSVMEIFSRRKKYERQQCKQHQNTRVLQ